MAAARRATFDITFGYEPDPERCIEAVTALLQWPIPGAPTKGGPHTTAESTPEAQGAPLMATHEHEAPDRR
jgi:hypothetical protein